MTTICIYMKNKDQLTHPKHCLHSRLRKANRVIASHYNTALKPTEVERTQFTLLFVINQLQKSTITQLGKQLKMEQTTVTRNIQVLQRKGFVRLTAGEDKRRRYVSLTEIGKTVVTEALPHWATAQTAVIDALGIEKAVQLLSLLDELVEKLTD